MNEQLQNALVNLLTKVTSGMDTATAFLSAELPEVVQQLLVWKLAPKIFLIEYVAYLTTAKE